MKKLKDKMEKIESIGTVNEMSNEEAYKLLLRVLNSTICKKKPVEEISIYEIEEMLDKIEQKYKLHIGYIMPVKISKEPALKYSFSLRNSSNHLKTLYARNIFEGMFKSLLYLYFYVKVDGRL